MAYAFVDSSSQYLSTTSAPVASGAYPITLFVSAKSPQESSKDKALLSLSTASGTSPLVSVFRVTFMHIRFTDNVQAADYETAHPDNIWFSVAGINGTTSTARAYVNAEKGFNPSNPIIGIWDHIEIGSRVSTIRGGYFNGDLAEAAIWNVALTDAEIASLAKGFRPTRIRPQSLVFYAPLLRNLQDLKGGLVLTNNNGATVADHPRVY